MRASVKSKLVNYTVFKTLMSRQISTRIAAGTKMLPEEQRIKIINAACQLQEAMETSKERIFRIMTMVSNTPVKLDCRKISRHMYSQMTQQRLG
jgi:hypothetical protein